MTEFDREALMMIDVCKHHNINLVFNRNKGIGSYYDSNTIEVPYPDTSEDITTFYHELGHKFHCDNFGLGYWHNINNEHKRLKKRNGEISLEYEIMANNYAYKLRPNIDESFLWRAFMTYVDGCDPKDLYNVASKPIDGKFREIVRYNYFLNLI